WFPDRQRLLPPQPAVALMKSGLRLVQVFAERLVASASTASMVAPTARGPCPPASEPFPLAPRRQPPGELAYLAANCALDPSQRESADEPHRSSTPTSARFPRPARATETLAA